MAYAKSSTSAGATTKFLDSFPYKLELGVDDLGRSLLTFTNESSATAGDVILVTKAYDHIFHRLQYCISGSDIRPCQRGGAHRSARHRHRCVF